MADKFFYGNALNYGGAMLDYCRNVLGYWKDGMDAPALLAEVLEKGADPNRTAKTAKHYVCELFKSRFLTPEALPWTRVLRAHLDGFPKELFEQCCYVLTARSERMFYDFVVGEYWPRVKRGEKAIAGTGLYKAFLTEAMEAGRGGGGKVWSEARMARLTASLSGVCSGFHLVNTRKKYAITPPLILTETAVLFALDLKERGLADREILDHPDWRLLGVYGSHEAERLLKSPSFAPYFRIEDRGGVPAFAWGVQTMKEAADRYGV